MIQIPVADSGKIIRLEAKTSERSDGSTMIGRWAKGRPGHVEVRFDLTDGAARARGATRTTLVMN